MNAELEWEAEEAWREMSVSKVYKDFGRDGLELKTQRGTPFLHDLCIFSLTLTKSRIGSRV